MSFWLPEHSLDPTDFYEIVRNVGGNIVEQVGRAVLNVYFFVFSNTPIIPNNTSRFHPHDMT